jgi:hypothetical protein
MISRILVFTFVVTYLYCLFSKIYIKGLITIGTHSFKPCHFTSASPIGGRQNADSCILSSCKDLVCQLVHHLGRKSDPSLDEGSYYKHCSSLFPRSNPIGLLKAGQSWKYPRYTLHKSNCCICRS